ncbi:ABC transporter family substrate-binding protein [Georgenia alba]|uniref:ABC transporter family substrate-binding protein n=1 Tax=Georgenia alba TaxID=2233858 RepID=A0ABW2Q643_9MICO
MRTKRGVAMLATGAAAVVVLGACSSVGGGQGEDAGNAGGGQEEPTGVVEGDGELFNINSHNREDLQDGGTLRIAIGEGLPSQWNPMHTVGNEGDISDVRTLMEVTNWHYNGEADYEPNENFLLDYTDEVVDGQQVITLNLNPDAVWNTGDPITWEDYEATLTACNGEMDVSCVQVDPYRQIESVEMGEDEFQVVITFKETYPDWSSLVSSVLPAESVSDAETFDTGWQNFEDTTDYWTGPFVVEDINESQQIIRLVPNENWWGDEPILDEVQFHAITIEAQPQAFQNGEVDAFEVGPDPNAYNIASDTPDASIRSAAGPDWRHITMNSEAGPLQELEVRQAVQQAVNTEAIMNSDLAGLPQEFALPLGNHIFVNGQTGYQDNSGEFGYDPQAAAATLDEAGWVMNEETGIRERDGEPLVIPFNPISGVPVSENEGQLVQEQLREVGIDVPLNPVPQDTWSELLDRGDYSMMPFSWLGTPYPMNGLAQIYGDPSVNDSNYANLNNDEINELIGQVDVETDEQTRIDLANQVDQLIWEEGHTLPLYQRPQIYATVDNLANYGALGFSSATPENWGYVAE